ncbi:hypothetical protein HOY80DRAFT_1102747, partial [Tuber brumale]
YTASQRHNYSLPLPRIVLPPIQRTGHIVLDPCTPTGSIEGSVVPKIPVKPEFREARKSGWGYLRALRAKSGTRRNVKIGGYRKILGSRLVAIMDPSCDRVAGIFKDEAWKETKEAKKVAWLQRKLWLGRGMLKWFASTRWRRERGQGEGDGGAGGQGDERRDRSDA